MLNPVFPICTKYFIVPNFSKDKKRLSIPDSQSLLTLNLRRKVFSKEELEKLTSVMAV